MFAEIVATLLDLSATKQGRKIFRRFWYTACTAIVLYTIAFNATVPFLTGFESVQQFWGVTQ